MTDDYTDNAEGDHDDIVARVDEARSLRRRDELETSQDMLLDLLDQYPDHPLVLFEVGGSFDVLGEEEEAIPYYRRALSEGLAGDDRQECLVCLGSSLRVIGETEEAVEVLRQATEEFPDRPSAGIFLGLALLDNGDENEAVAALLDIILRTTNNADIQSYAGTIEYYRDELLGVLDE